MHTDVQLLSARLTICDYNCKKDWKSKFVKKKQTGKTQIIDVFKDMQIAGCASTAYFEHFNKNIKTNYLRSGSLRWNISLIVMFQYYNTNTNLLIKL